MIKHIWKRRVQTYKFNRFHFGGKPSPFWKIWMIELKRIKKFGWPELRGKLWGLTPHNMEVDPIDIEFGTSFRQCMKCYYTEIL